LFQPSYSGSAAYNQQVYHKEKSADGGAAAGTAQTARSSAGDKEKKQTQKIKNR
jgi:hypothetical protein